MNASNTIWIINQYASTPTTGVGGRHYYLAQELAKQGYNVYVIASSANHLLHQQPHLDQNITFEPVAGFTFVWIKMPQYTQAHSRQRVLNWFLFSWRLHKLEKSIPDKPDSVLCSSPSPLTFLGAHRLAKRFSARLIFEVRDIWPLTLMEIGGYSANHPFIRLMQWVENRAYRDSYKVISNLKNAVEHMIEHGLNKDKFTWVANGFSLDEVNNNEPLSQIVSQQLPKNKFVIGYTGTLGVANSLDTLIDAAEILKGYEAISFVLVGRGREKARLKARVDKINLNNVIFIDAIPKVQIQAMLSTFDACFIGWLKDDLYRFGIAANKIPEYFYAGKPVIHSYGGACDPVSQFNAGLLAEPENPKALADAVLKLYQMPEHKRKILGENGHKASVEHYEYGMLSKKLAGVLFDV